MTLSMILVIISVFSFSLWFKRSEMIKENDSQAQLAILEKTSWFKSIKFAFMMTLLMTFQWIVLKIILLS